jgi:hypothetical protein
MKYIYPINFDFNLEHFKAIMMEEMTRPFVNSFPYYQRDIGDNVFLNQVRQKYPILSNSYNIYHVLKGKTIPPHIDSDRMVALNIPIFGTENTSTVFYSCENYDSSYVDQFIYDAISGNIKEEFRFCLDRPTLINTKQIHSVVNPNPYMRIVMSWNIIPGYSYEDAVEWFKAYQDATQQNNP